ASSFKEGGEVFLTFYFQEIQRLKTLEKERADMERWAGLGRIMEDVFHQIREPIASIGAQTRRLSAPSSKDKSALSRVVKDAGRLEKILQRVEEYIRIPRPDFRRDKIQEVVESVLPSVSRKGKEKSISFRLDTRALEGDGQFFMDTDLIRRVVSHVLENSLEAVSGAKGKNKVIDIAVFDDGDNVGLSVADRGVGISKKNLNLIFDPFFSTSPDRVGLGLTFVRRVMEEHRGRIRVDSRVNRGTKVTLYFSKDRRRRLRREFLSPEAGVKPAAA
ncbi:MAG TPA: ATP-binding protein, partial [Thermodesulfobacteriota bacterium]|nr:ATP-binding protein [Thermodesulfobacteriota bacterium]